MFGRKKDGAKISDRAPVFHVRYVGSTVTHAATGTGCSYVPAQRLWDNSPAQRDMRKVAIKISPKGLHLRDTNEKSPPPTTTIQQQHHHQHHHHQQEPYYHHNNDNTQQQQQLQHQQRPISQDFEIENISFCNVDRAVNERLFSWIYRQPDIIGVDDQRRRSLVCHAVLCSTAAKAQTMAIVLSRAFQIAYKDWKAHHRPSSHPLSRISTPAASPNVQAASGQTTPEEEKRNNTKNNNNNIGSASSTPPVTSKSTSSPMTPSTEERAHRGTREHQPGPSNILSPSFSSSSSSTSSTSPPPFFLQSQGSRFPSKKLDDEVVGADDAAPKGVTSAASGHQASPLFATNRILWDADLRERMAGEGEVDFLHANLDLEEEEDEEEGGDVLY